MKTKKIGFDQHLLKALSETLGEIDEVRAKIAYCSQDSYDRLGALRDLFLTLDERKLFLENELLAPFGGRKNIDKVMALNIAME